MDIYRLIKFCGILVFLWVVKILLLENFRSGLATNPPAYNVVDNFETLFEGEDSSRPLVEVYPERGRGGSVVLVEAWRAEELENEYIWVKRKAWMSLLLALMTGVGIATIGQYIWDSWPLGIAAAILGPAGIAWAMYELKDKG